MCAICLYCYKQSLDQCTKTNEWLHGKRKTERERGGERERQRERMRECVLG